MNIKILFITIILSISGISTGVSEILVPNKEITAKEIIKIQLNALMNNDEPFKDAGIEQVWNLAHPRNQSMTGPYPIFKQMLYDENYSILINHTSHKIKLIKEKENINVFAVTILSKENQNYIYIWVVQKVQHGLLKGCWLTTSVSFPKYDGDSI